MALRATRFLFAVSMWYLAPRVGPNSVVTATLATTSLFVSLAVHTATASWMSWSSRSSALGRHVGLSFGSLRELQPRIQVLIFQAISLEATQHRQIPHHCSPSLPPLPQLTCRKVRGVSGRGVPWGLMVFHPSTTMRIRTEQCWCSQPRFLRHYETLQSARGR